MEFKVEQIKFERGQPQKISARSSLFLSMLAYRVAATEASVVLICQNQSTMGEHLKSLRFFLRPYPHLTIRAFPTDEKTIYHAAACDPLVSMERMGTLFSIASGQAPSILLLPAEALSQKVLGLAALQKYAQVLVSKSSIDRGHLINSLALMGYIKVPLVMDRGTYAVRGSVIDIFPSSLRDPVRVDLFGDDIESIKYFDPSTQRSTRSLDEIMVGPAREIMLDSATKTRAKTQLWDLCDELNYPTKKLNEKLHDIDNGIYFFGIEKLLPAFYENFTSILELYQTAQTAKPVVIFEDQASILGTVASLENAHAKNYETAIARGEMAFGPDLHWFNEAAVKQTLSQFRSVDVATQGPFDWEAPCRDVTDIRQAILQESMAGKEHEAPLLLKPLAAKIKSLHNAKTTVVLLVSSKEKEAHLKALLAPHGLNINSLKDTLALNIDWSSQFKNHIHAYVAVSKHLPAAGAVFDFIGLALITEEDIFGPRTRRKNVGGKQGGFATSLADLNPGDLVVHVDHGIGQFKGITRLTLHGVASDYVLIHYAKEEKLYLPIHRINLIKPYGALGEGAVARLDKLGGTTWQSKKSKANEAVMAMAQDLLKLYAKREMVQRTPFQAPDAHFFEFCDNFQFETTPDQQKAIDDVVSDMQRLTPMDRLVCGDVGYGKTEVAMRAAMLAVLSKKQVAILAPTTVLAQQHAINFAERFKNTGVSVEILSRFQKPTEVKQTVTNLRQHKADIVIGTHRLLSPDIEFADLGLIVVDEEQRFGIKSKEHLKKMRTKVDVLTMSATPIPRTLQMSYFGIRDLSIIETAPVDRRAIQTYVVQFDDALIKEAMEREISRGGQVYFVHNRVSSIQATAEYLKGLVPEAKIAVAHGQMPEQELEQKMLGFMRHEINVLVCTTIIETGIDVSTANTMFIDDADDFGLSQLYQLRGRIGRSKERAFAYLLTKTSTEHLTPIAKTRLDILHKFSELGAGFRIAQHDLELRGAGDLLGRQQHGHMAAIGYDLYAELLKEAVNSLQGKSHEDDIDPEVVLPVSALIPEKYCDDLHERMAFYQRLAMATSKEQIEAILGELTEMFGDAPDEIRALAASFYLKIDLIRMRALKLEVAKGVDEKHLTVSVLLSQKAPVEHAKLLAAMKSDAMKITPQHKIIQSIGISEPDKIDAILQASYQALSHIRERLF
jgi:transcription-repair coupling factor (superfamily II helicase)